MEHYSVIKNKDIIHFSGKWMQLEHIILSEVIQTQKDTYDIHVHYKWTLAIKCRITILQSTDLKKLGSMEVPREYSQISVRSGKYMVIRGEWREGTG